jgi:homoserine dehydrogenase
MTAPARVLLAGAGRVGQAFLELAADRPEFLVAGVARSRGPSVGELLAEGEWHAVADATPTDLESGGPALEHARLALGRGVHFATAAKGPLVTGYGEVCALARSTGAGFRFSAATGAGLPTVDTVEFALAGSRLERIEGVLNGTSNFILDRMGQGCELEAALAEARRAGIADGDGSQDISGRDTAAKLVAIANAAWWGPAQRESSLLLAGRVREGVPPKFPLSLQDVDVTGIQDLSSASVCEAATSGVAYRLVGTAAVDEAPRVRPERLDAGHPLASVHGAEKAISFRTDTMGTLTLTGGKSDPRAAGAALLRDVLLLLRVGGRA